MYPRLKGVSIALSVLCLVTGAVVLIISASPVLGQDAPDTPSDETTEDGSATPEATWEPSASAVEIRNWIGENLPFLVRETLPVLENWQWIGLLIIIILGFALSRFAAFLILQFFRRVFKRKRFKLDEELEKGFVRPIRVAIMAWVCWAALAPLGLPNNIMDKLQIVVTGISAVAAIWAVYRLVDILGSYLAERAKKTNNRFDDLIVPLIVRALKVFVICFGAIFVADQLDIDYAAALGAVGLGGLAFALAAQDTVSNVFGSLTILFDKPFQIGDWVVIGDVDGSVEEVGIRSTRVRTFYNSLVTVPNSVLINAVVDNYGERRYRRIKTMIGLTYDTPPDKIEAFCEGVRELIRQHPYTRKDYFHVYLNEFAASSLNILLYCFHECPDWSTELRERQRLYLDIMRLANRLGVEFAFPTQTLHMQKEGETEYSSQPLVPPNEALELGRNQARDVIGEFGEKGSEKPPPVSFDPPTV